MKNMNKRKSILLLTAVVLAMAFGVGGTLAYLLDKTDPVVNTFTPSEVKVDIHESFDGKTKNNVTIENTGSVKAYIRAAVLVSWQNEDGNVMPINSSDYTITWTKSGWSDEQTDGFYYYKTAIIPGQSTGELFTACKLNANVTPPAEGYTLHVEVIAQAIQAEPADVVTDTWGVDPTEL